MTFPPEFVLPGPGGLRAVLAATAAAIGAEVREDFGGAAAVAGEARAAGEAGVAADARAATAPTADNLLPTLAAGLQLPTAARACIVLVDGLGATQLADRSGHFPFLRNRSGNTLTTVAPSTTAAALTAFGTAAAPGQTGMLGYTVRSPEGNLLNLIRWAGTADDMRAWQTVPTVFERLLRPERNVVLAPARFSGAGLTVAALRGTREVVAESLADRVDATITELSSARADLAYLYWGEVDHVGHDHGWQSWQWGEEAGRTDSEIERLARGLPRDTLLVVISDHGMVDVTSRTDVAFTPLLSDGVDLIAGEPRATHIFTARPEEVAARWRDYWGERAWIGTRAEASHLFGPVAERFREVVGDVVVMMRGTDVVVDSRTQTASSIALIGVHGSLTAAEMQIPLLLELT